jgi:hypothetical protein
MCGPHDVDDDTKTPGDDAQTYDDFDHKHATKTTTQT